jgi:aspartyl protease family protein
MSASPRMRRLGLALAVLGIGLAIVLALTQTGRRGNPNPRPTAQLGMRGVLEVVLEQNQLDQYVTTGRINGKRVDMLVDTGCADVALPFDLARQLGLSLTPGNISKTGNGNVQSWSAWLDSVDVGGLEAKKVKATVLPNLGGNQALLGMAYLKYMEVVLAGGRMTLRPYITP